MLSKQYGISLPNPTHTAGANWTSSYFITGHLATALYRTAEFRSRDYALLMREGREEIRRRHTEAVEKAPGRGLGLRIQAGHPTAGEDPADRGVAVRAPLHRQWGKVRGAGMEEFPLPALWH